MPFIVILWDSRGGLMVLSSLSFSQDTRDGIF